MAATAPAAGHDRTSRRGRRRMIDVLEVLRDGGAGERRGGCRLREHRVLQSRIRLREGGRNTGRASRAHYENKPFHRVVPDVSLTGFRRAGVVCTPRRAIRLQSARRRSDALLNVSHRPPWSRISDAIARHGGGQSRRLKSQTGCGCAYKRYPICRRSTRVMDHPAAPCAAGARRRQVVSEKTICNDPVTKRCRYWPNV